MLKISPLNAYAIYSIHNAICPFICQPFRWPQCIFACISPYAYNVHKNIYLTPPQSVTQWDIIFATNELIEVLRSQKANVWVPQ